MFVSWHLGPWAGTCMQAHAQAGLHHPPTCRMDVCRQACEGMLPCSGFSKDEDAQKLHVPYLEFAEAEIGRLRPRP